MFGTSSQLVSAESPLTIRRIQQAIRESEAVLPLQETAWDDAPTDQAYVGRPLSLIKASRRLWSVAARDHDDGTLAAAPSLSELGCVDTAGENRSNFIDIDSLLSDSPVVLQAKNISEPPRSGPPYDTPAEEVPHPGQSSTGPDDALVTVANEMKKPFGAQQQDALQPLAGNARSESSDRSQHQSPKEDPKEDALGALDAGSTKPAKKPRGRPRKDPSQPPKPRKPRKATASGTTSIPAKRHRKSSNKKKNSRAPDECEWHQIDDISDLEPAPTLSPPRRRASQPPPPTQPLELESTAPKQAPFASTSKRANIGPINATEQLLWPELSARLFPMFTAMVKTEPPTTDPRKPSWHEKILMYDPIIVEDLTEWLTGRINVEGLGKNALKPWMVQKWCEENSICCVMKNNGWH